MGNRPNSKRFSKGETIFTEGEPGDHVYIIETGKVEISIKRASGRSVLSLLEKGEIFGELAVIDRAVRTSTATCIEETHVTIVSRRLLKDRVNKADPIVRMLLKVVIERLQSEILAAEGKINEINKDVEEFIAKEREKTGTDVDRIAAFEKIRAETHLAEAVEKDQFILHYQPIMDLRTGEVAGFEALIRWNHPENGLVGPYQFIELAEETNLILPIGKWVMEQAFRDLKTIQHAYMAAGLSRRVPFVSVNISGKQIGDANFHQDLEKALRSAQVLPKHVKLEITESELVNAEKAREWIAKCKKIGTQIALDDFGTGYSSLSYLSQFQIDTLKLDKTFMDQTLVDRTALLIGRSVIGLAADLNLNVIAEGIEVRDHLRVLKSLHCQYGQGYFFSKPAPLDDAIDFLVNRTNPSIKIRPKKKKVA